MAFKLPWSNFHELNLDWVLEQIKELSEKVDAFIGSAIPSNDPPVMDGTASAGSSVNYARGDHVHPTDTSRASASDLSALDTTVYNNYVELHGDINTVDAKIAFDSAAPAMDGVASPGSSAYQARADHVHPTDTSRASKSEFDTLKATVDAFAGSATPYDTMPAMDGAGSPGIAGGYSRGDHQHPSDSTKFDKTGGTITGDTTIEGSLIQKKNVVRGFTDSIGWRRVANVPNLDGTALIMTIQRRDTNNYSESHRLSFVINNGALFFNETSKSSAQLIDKIRYTDAGKLDIHVDQVDGSYIAVYLEQYAPGETEAKAIHAETSMTLVDDAPAGETIVSVYDLSANTEEPDVIVDEVQRTNVSIAASGATYTFEESVAKTGYIPIGIVYVRTVNLSGVFRYTEYIENDTVKVIFYNTTATVKSYATIRVGILYKKEVYV